MSKAKTSGTFNQTQAQQQHQVQQLQTQPQSATQLSSQQVGANQFSPHLAPGIQGFVAETASMLDYQHSHLQDGQQQNLDQDPQGIISFISLHIVII